MVDSRFTLLFIDTKVYPFAIMAFRYEELRVTKTVRFFIVNIYKTTKTFPDREKYGLTSQLERAATSILLNIAEGSARKTPKEFQRFITIALGSAMECHAAITIALDLGIIKKFQHRELSDEIKDIWITLCSLRTSQKP